MVDGTLNMRLLHVRILALAASGAGATLLLLGSCGGTPASTCAGASCQDASTGLLADATLGDAGAPDGNTLAQGDAYLCPSPACPTAPVAFELTVAGDPTRFCTSSCGSQWLSIRAADGGYLASSGGTDGCGNTLDCCECQVFDGGCAQTGYSCEGQALSDAGLRGAWGGQVSGISTCGAQNSECTFGTCVGPGSYVALMCATVSDGGALYCSDFFNSDEKCVTVPFVLPSAGVVRGTLTP